MKLTDMERAMLQDIVDSDYQDGGNPVNQDIWFDYVVDTKSKGGIFTSLQAKGFVQAYVTKTRIDPRNPDLPTESTICITQSGFDAFNQK